MKCPQCTNQLEWIGGTSISPESVQSAYLCPNPDCGMTLVKVVVEE